MEQNKQDRYIARPVDWGYAELGLKQTPAAQIQFEFEEEPGKKRQVTYTGWLTPKARPYTIKALMVCGFKDDDLEKFAAGLNGKALDTTKDVSITIAEEKKNDKVFLQVKGIWPLSRVAGLSKQPDLKGKLSKLNINGDILAIKQQKNTATVAESTDTQDDLPW